MSVHGFGGDISTRVQTGRGEERIELLLTASRPVAIRPHTWCWVTHSDVLAVCFGGGEMCGTTCRTAAANGDPVAFASKDKQVSHDDHNVAQCPSSRPPLPVEKGGTHCLQPNGNGRKQEHGHTPPSVLVLGPWKVAERANITLFTIKPHRVQLHRHVRLRSLEGVESHLGFPFGNRFN